MSYWIVFKESQHKRIPHFKRKYLQRPLFGTNWHWTWKGTASRFQNDAEAYEYAVKYHGSVEEVA